MSHIPVLKNEVIRDFAYLKEKQEWVFLDGTLGAGGHSIELLKNQESTKNKKIIGVDQDLSATLLAKKNIKSAGFKNNFIIVHNNFKNIEEILSQLEIKNIDGALLDLGVSSMQLDQMQRGFSFKDLNQKLDMRMDQTVKPDAAWILNNYPESKLARTLTEFGEERFAQKIARSVIEARKKKKIELVGDLISILESTIPKKFQFGRTHFATKTFQALRIEVNHELDILEKAIFDITEKLNSKSTFAIITFHSLEDRIVKQTFAKLEKPCQCPPALPCICGKKPIAVIKHKPITASTEEIGNNNRARSAKLRGIEKI